MAITEIEDKISEIINKSDHDNFIYDFLGVYDIPKATVTKLKKGINNLSDVEGEVYLKNKLYYKQTDSDLMQSFMGYIDEPSVVAAPNLEIYDATLWLLGILLSNIHMVWVNHIGGRLKNDFRYSAGLDYNTFPIPELSTRRKNEIEQLVLNILDIREEEGGTLAELYGSPLAEKNPKPMNPRLLKAHQELDEVVDRAYKTNGFKDDNERLALLLEMYSEKIKDEK